jgi:hypothetical protein
MQMTILGLLCGIALAFGILLDGFAGFAIVAILGAVGILVGRVLDGQLDLGGLVGQASSRQRR